MKNPIRNFLLCAAAISVFSLPSPAATISDGDWPYFGNDRGETKFSPLAQITPANVKALKQVWVYDTQDPSVNPRGWEVSPIVVNDIMYFPTARGKITALNAETGEERWH
jgi:quinoprotein glucose dehydrogenase